MDDSEGEVQRQSFKRLQQVNPILKELSRNCLSKPTTHCWFACFEEYSRGALCIWLSSKAAWATCFTCAVYLLPAARTYLPFATTDLLSELPLTRP
jgi:hypothetical protein